MPRSWLRRLTSWLGRQLENGRLPLYLAALAILLTLPALGTGLQMDDLGHRLVMLGHTDWPISPLAVFSFFDGSPAGNARALEAGLLPWWTPMEFRLSFCRTLSAASMWLDYKLWPDQPWLMHAHGLLWLGALVLAATAFFRRTLGASRAAPSQAAPSRAAWSSAGLAALLFAVDDAHAMPSAWLANRNALLATCFGVLAVTLHARDRQAGLAGESVPGWRRLLAPLCLLLGLLSGEMALAAAGYLVAYALFLDPAPWRARLLSLVPCGATGLAWAIGYRLAHFGAWGSGMYIDPASQPLRFLAAFVRRAPVLVLGQWTPVPADLNTLLAAEGQRQLVLAGWLVVGLVAALFLPLVRTDARARFCAAGMLLSLVPIAGTFPANRTLFFVGLGAAGLLALQAERWLVPREGRATLGERWRGWVTVALLVVHLPLSALLTPAMAWSMRSFGDPLTQAMRGLPRDPDLAGKSLIVVQAPDYLLFVSFLRGYQEYLGLPPAPRLRALVIGPVAAEVARPDERTLVVSLDGDLFQGAIGHLFRSEDLPMAAGERVALSDLTITVEAVTAAGAPQRVRYVFAGPLESAPVRFVGWKDGAFAPWSPPAVGETVRLPRALGPFETLQAGSP